jgi:regulator of nonsense transcripts 2
MVSLCEEADKAVVEYPLKVVASVNTQNELKMLVTEVYEQLCTATVTAHKDMVSKEKRFEKERVLHGTLNETKQLELDNSKRLFEKLISAVTSISECTGDPLPVMQVDKDTIDSAKGISVWEGATVLGDYGPYEDAESKSFYEDLPDLLVMVPLAALGFTPEQAAAIREQWSVVEDKSAADEDDTVDESLLGGADADDVKEEVSDKPSESDKAATELEDTPQVRVAALLEEKLPDVTTKQKANEFCVSFCYLNSKVARKKLVAALLKINRNRYELFGTYSRIVASLNRLFPLDIAPPILEDLQRHFFGSFKAKSQFYIESKIKTVRFVGELVKFKVAPPITAFRMMKLLLSDMTRHNVELLTSMLETCGRYLYLLPATQERMQETLQTMLRLRSAKNLDLHQQAMIEAAYFTVKPPERVARVKKELTTLQKYIRYLLSTRLDLCLKAGSPKACKESVDDLIKSIRKLPWSDPLANVEIELAKSAMKTSRKKYVNIPVLADVLSGLSVYRPNFTCRLVDMLLEEIQHEVEEPHKRVHQRTIGLVKLVGELYNYTTLSSAVIFELLHALVRYVNPKTAQTDITLFSAKISGDTDASSDNFRIQLVAELLNTTGGYYVSGNAKERLIRFLSIFQRFLLIRPGLPMHIEFCVLDLFDRLELLAREAGGTLYLICSL